VTLPRNPWALVRDAIVQAMIRASGLDESHVLWAYQNTNQPTDDYIDLSISGSENPCQDAIVATTDLTRPAGEEIQLATQGFREVVLSVEVYTKTTVTSDEELDALAIAERIRSAIILPTLRDRALKFGVSFFDSFGAAQYLPKLISTGFRGFALLHIRMFIPAVAAVEYTGYINTVNGTVKVTDDSGITDEFTFHAEGSAPKAPTGTDDGQQDNTTRWDHWAPQSGPWTPDTPIPSGAYSVTVPSGVGTNAWVKGGSGFTTDHTLPPGLAANNPPPGTMVSDGGEGWIIAPPWRAGWKVFTTTDPPDFTSNDGETYICDEDGVT